MSRRTRVGRPGLLLRHWSTAPIGGVILAVLIGLAVFCTAAAPRVLGPLADRELGDALSALDGTRSDLTFVGDLGDGTFGVREGADAAFDAVDAGLRGVPSSFEEPLRGIASGDSDWLAHLQVVATITPANTQGPRIRPTVDLSYLDRVRFVEGAAPAVWAGDSSDGLRPAERPPIDVAVSAEAARSISAEVGSVFAADPAPVRISGVFEAVDADDPFWLHDPQLLSPRSTRQLLGASDLLDLSAYLAPGSLDGLGVEAQGATLTAWYPTTPAVLRYADADALLLRLRQLDTVGLSLETGQSLTFSSGLTPAIEQAQGRVAAVSALLALVASAPLGVVFAVLLLAAQGVAARREATLRLAAARGAGALRVRGIALGEGALIALPASALALVLAIVLVPASVPPGALVPALLVAALVPAYLFAAGMPGGSDLRRADLGSRRRGRARGVLEIGVIALAVLALVLLDRRGLVTAGSTVGIDPLLAATPLLLSLAVSVIVLRVYPIPLLALQRGARRRRSAVGLVGAARAVRDPALGFASALAIVVAVSAAVFSGVMASTVSTGVEAAARQEVGADIRVDGPSLDPQAVGRTPGVQDAAGLALVPATDARSLRTRLPVTLVVADLADLSVVRPDLPDSLDAPDSTDGGDGIPFLVSSELAERLRSTEIELGGVPAVRAGVLDARVVPGAGTDWVLVDRADAAGLADADAAPNLVLATVSSDADAQTTADAISAELGDRATVVDVASVTERIVSRPSIATLITTLWVAATLALVLGAVAIAAAVVAASGARNRVIAVMRTLGASRRQLRGLVAWELVPVLVFAGLAGLALGLALPFLVAGLVDLRTFVGGTAPISPDIPVLLVAGIALGFTAAAALAGTVAITVARRVDPASELKIGAT